MYDYRLFFPSGPIEEPRATRRPSAGEDARRRVYRVEPERRDSRRSGRR